MPYNWGPFYIVPSTIPKTYSGQILLRENYDDDLLTKELNELNLNGNIIRVVNPWYYRQVGSSTLIKIGESSDRSENFAVRWNTANIPDGEYEIFGLMHVTITKDNAEYTIARQNVVRVKVKN